MDGTFDVGWSCLQGLYVSRMHACMRAWAYDWLIPTLLGMTTTQGDTKNSLEEVSGVHIVLDEAGLPASGFNCLSVSPTRNYLPAFLATYSTVFKTPQSSELGTSLDKVRDVAIARKATNKKNNQLQYNFPLPTCAKIKFPDGVLSLTQERLVSSQHTAFLQL